MIYTDEMIAEAIHVMNGLLQKFHGEEPAQPPWESAPVEMRARVLSLVAAYRRGITPREAHATWVARMTASGWVHGPAKDFAKLTHPNLVPYGDLPDSQKIKDLMSHQIATVLVTESRRLWPAGAGPGCWP